VNGLHSIAGHWSGGFDDAGLRTWAEGLRRQLAGPPHLGLVFLTPALFPHASAILEVLRVHAQIPLLAGCSSTSLVVNERELENDTGLVLALHHLPGAELKGVRFTQAQVEEATNTASAAYWHGENGLEPAVTNGWLAFADPFHLDSESWLRQWNEAYAPLPIVGGLASGDFSQQATQIYLNGEVFDDGGVAIAIGGAVELHSVISQGCTPIGDTWTLTRVDRNLIQQIGNRPAYEVLLDTFNALSAEDQKKAQRNLFIGLVTDEYREEFQRGDFLVRNLLGADPKTGIIAVGALPRAGQTMQFQRRDAAAAREDMCALLGRARAELAGRTILGGCLCCCNGRGQGLFEEPNHDAACVQELLGPLGLSGFFCNGEIGPVGGQNFLHGYTASLALFVAKE
jgi:small ligand-binding sensory domain FIST